MKLPQVAFSLLIVALIVTGLTACKEKCEGVQQDKGQAMIPYWDRPLWFPYTPMQEIRFVKNSTDTIAFLGGAIETSFDKNKDGCCTDCPTYYQTENTRQTFAASGDTLVIHSMVPTWSGDYPFNWTYVITLNKYLFPNYPSSGESFSLNAPLEVRGRKYTNVSYMIIVNSRTDIDTVYFNYPSGILRIKTGSSIYDRVP